MSITCSPNSSETDSIACLPDAPKTSNTAPSPGRTDADNSNRRAILLDDPTGTGFAVKLPPATDDPQAAIDAIYAETPFIPYLKLATNPTTYDTVDEFLKQHPHGESMRPILESHFDYSG